MNAKSNQDLNLNLGPVLKDARTAAELSVSATQRATGISRANIAAYEAGRLTPAVPTLLRLLIAYGLDDLAAVISGLDASRVLKSDGSVHPGVTPAGGRARAVMTSCAV